MRRLRDAANDRIKLLERQLQYRIQTKQAKNGHMYTGVLALDIKPYLQEWISHGHTLRTLADKAMLAESTLESIMRNRTETVRLDTADRILTALGIPHILNNIVPDPPEGQYYEE